MSWKRIFDLFMPETSISYKSITSANNKYSSNSQLTKQYGSETYQTAKSQDLSDTISQARNDLSSSTNTSNTSDVLQYLDKMDEINSWYSKIYGNSGTTASSAFNNLFSNYDSWPSYSQDWSSWYK